MGLFDLFKGGARSDKSRPKGSAAAKWADRLERRAQNYDRQEAIHALAEMGTADAARLLLKRFTFHIDPSITDQEEKDAAFRGILRAGKAAIEPVRAFAAKAESLAWPMKIMHELVDETEYVEELLSWLGLWDTEYAKFVEPKVQILAELEEHKHEHIRGGVERFLDDVNEPARFHAVAALLAQDDPAATPALAQTLNHEESVRVRQKVIEGLAARGWPLPEAEREAGRKALPAGFSMDGSGRIVARR
ncbi:MAG: HEAT repeat domain-containing protein [Myxococcota bacterium]|nr:HEAT repeat domain-containing protein [Myxococcota bacterium]